MKSGETAKVYCPARMDQGGHPNQLTHFGSGWIPTYTDMTYEFDVKECSLSPKSFKPDPVVPDLIDGDEMDKNHLYQIRALSLNKFGKQMDLDVDHFDKYAPMVTGVHNVFLSEKDTKSHSQNFFYD